MDEAPRSDHPPDLFRVYYDPAEVGLDGYPYAWHKGCPETPSWAWGGQEIPAIKDLVRELAEHRCVRCGHPYRTGGHAMEQVTFSNGVVRNELWSPCDERCTHRAPLRYRFAAEPWARDGLIATVYGWQDVPGCAPTRERLEGAEVEALWRILTVHHLNGVKHDCRWWNLASLCQRCHLTIQSKVFMERPYNREHSEWFKPHAAGFYAWKYLGLELTHEETVARLDELLAIEKTQEALF